MLWRGGALQRLSKGSALGEGGEAAQHVQGLAEEVQGAETRGITESEGVEELVARPKPAGKCGGGWSGRALYCEEGTFCFLFLRESCALCVPSPPRRSRKFL